MCYSFLSSQYDDEHLDIHSVYCELDLSKVLHSALVGHTTFFWYSHSVVLLNLVELFTIMTARTTNTISPKARRITVFMDRDWARLEEDKELLLLLNTLVYLLLFLSPTIHNKKRI